MQYGSCNTHALCLSRLHGEDHWACVTWMISRDCLCAGGAVKAVGPTWASRVLCTSIARETRSRNYDIETEERLFRIYTIMAGKILVQILKHVFLHGVRCAQSCSMVEINGSRHENMCAYSLHAEAEYSRLLMTSLLETWNDIVSLLEYYLVSHVMCACVCARVCYHIFWCTQVFTYLLNTRMNPPRAQRIYPQQPSRNTTPASMP